MSGVHALCSPSGAHRWTECPAAPAMEHVVGKPQSSSEDSRQGTAAHTLGEWVLSQHECSSEPLPVSNWLGENVVVKEDGKKYTYPVTQEMCDSIEKYVEYIESIPHEKTYIEEKVDYSHLVKDGFGYADCIFETVEKIDGKPCPTLYVIDYKNGFKYVNAYNNPQGKLYSIGALRSLKGKIRKDIKRVVIVIIQPRVDNISEYETTVKELETWGNEVVKPKGELAIGLYNFAKDSRPNPDSEGKHDLTIKPEMFGPANDVCFWCRAKDVCKPRAKAAISTVMEGFDVATDANENNMKRALESLDVDEPKKAFKDVLTTDIEELSACLKLESFVTKWFSDVRERLLKAALEGETIEGFKPVQSYGNRTWSLEDTEIAPKLRTAGLKKAEYEIVKVCTPPQAETKLKKSKPGDWKKRFEKLEEYIHCPEKGIVLAPEYDKRPSVAPVKEDLSDFLEGFDLEEENEDLSFLSLPGEPEEPEDLSFLEFVPGADELT